ncbi:MAG TPA: DUF503 domain-containing protein [Syntrophomonadaceae bacterium]|nr:DUF503 domain-containing protein [Syntrophomonadaceae bacterium]
MYAVYGYSELFHPFSSSLKEKRMTIQSIIARMRKRFNVSVSEVSHQDLWQRSGIGFSAVSSSYSELELIIDAIRDTIENHGDDYQILSFDYRIVSWDDQV